MKKIMSMAVAVIMTSSMLPGTVLQNAGAATAENKNADMYAGKLSVTSKNMEDFEGFEVGTACLQMQTEQHLQTIFQALLM